MRVLHADGRRPGRPADGWRRRAGRADRGHHRRCRGEPKARRAIRHSLPGPAAGADGSRLASTACRELRWDIGSTARDASPANWPWAPSRCCNWQPASASDQNEPGESANGSAPHAQNDDPSLARSRLNRSGLKAGTEPPISGCRGSTEANCRWPTSGAGRCCWCFLIPTAAPAMNWRRGCSNSLERRTCRCSW